MVSDLRVRNWMRIAELVAQYRDLPLGTALERSARVVDRSNQGTTRNWNTVLKLATLGRPGTSVTNADGPPWSRLRPGPGSRQQIRAQAAVGSGGARNGLLLREVGCAVFGFEVRWSWSWDATVCLL